MLKETQVTQKTAEKKTTTQWKASNQLSQWMSEQQVSIALTSDSAGKLFLIGTETKTNSEQNTKTSVVIFEETFGQCTSLCAHNRSLYLSNTYQIWRLNNILKENENYSDFDGIYLPQMAYTTGHIHCSDIAINNKNQLIFVNTNFSCLATTTPEQSFIPIWQPSFISELVPEDRCHLTGLALRAGEVNYVTSISQSNTKMGWTTSLQKGGIVIDTQTNQIICDDLSIPQSPRYHQNKLWLLESGSGYLGTVDTQQHTFQPKVFCPGFIRGLDFIDNYAIVAFSKPNKTEQNQSLPLWKNLQQHESKAASGFCVIDLSSNTIIHQLTLEGDSHSLFDIALLHKIKKPRAIGFTTDEIGRTFLLNESTESP